MRRPLAALALVMMFTLPSGTASAEPGHDDLAPAPEATMPLGEDIGNTLQPFPKDTPPAKTPLVVLVSSWPSSDAELVAAPREGRLTFDKPVRPVDVSLQLLRAGTTEPVTPASATRTEFTKDLRTIRFALPALTPGAWKMEWAAGESSGELIFVIEKPIEAPGGGNHRHDSGLLAGYNIFERLALGALLLYAALGVFWRGRRSRVVGAAVAVYVSVVGAASALALVDGASFLDNGTQSTAKGLAAPGVWTWLAIAAIAWLLAAVPATSLRTRVGLLAFVGLGHATALNVHTVAAKPILATSGAVLSATAFIAAVAAIAQHRSHLATLPSGDTTTPTPLSPGEATETADLPTGDTADDTAVAVDAAEQGIVSDVANDTPTSTARVSSTLPMAVFATATLVSVFTVWSRSNFGTFEDDFASAAALRVTAGVVLVASVPAQAFAARTRRPRLIAAVTGAQLAAIAFLATPAPLAAGLGGESL
jgi:hypothetical protein